MEPDVRQNLIDAGCSGDFVGDFGRVGSDAERLRMLRGYRGELLGRIHAEQRKLDCLDYLIFKMRQRQR